MFVMRAAVGVEANPWTGGKVALAHKEFSNTAEVSRKVREDSILREILSRGLPSVCCYRYFPSDVGSRSRTRRLSKVSVATGIIPDPASDCWNLTYISFQFKRPAPHPIKGALHGPLATVAVASRGVGHIRCAVNCFDGRCGWQALAGAVLFFAPRPPYPARQPTEARLSRVFCGLQGS